jgi:peptidoglycan/xylan/chitin deacetylase (PgdA/CDA1 family)
MIKALSAIALVLYFGCSRTPEVLNPDDNDAQSEFISIEVGYVPTVKKCLWFDDKAAACTISFDDARISHYQVAGPALDARNMKGTFFLNTRNITDWSGYQSLFNNGHEIASHTFSHPKLTELSESQQREELTRAISDIRAHIIGLTAIPSFSYPYGLYDDQVRRVVRDFHSSARGNWGLNSANLSDEELTLVRGVGIYPPFDITETARTVERAISERAWIMVYFHSVSAQGDSANEIIPLARYVQHLDYIQGRQDSLWIATMGEVTAYLRLRRDASVQTRQTDSTALTLSLDSLQGFYSDVKPLTVRLTLPQSWHGQEVAAVKSDSSAQPIRRKSAGEIYINVPRSGSVRLSAKKSS